MGTTQAKQSGFAQINGADLYYEVAGSGNAVVFNHAGIADHRMWDDQFDAFAAHYRVIRFDHRGVGRSSMPPGPFARREDLYTQLRFLGVERAAIVGCSGGGGSALDCALAHRDAVAALVLVGTAVSGLDFGPEAVPQGPEIFGAIDAATARGDLATAVELELRVWVDGLHRTPEQVPAAVRERVRQMRLGMLRRAPELERGQPQPLQPPAIQRLGGVHCPTLVVVGDEDVPPMLTTAELLAKTIRGARKAVIHDTAHLPNMEQPNEFNALLFDFLASVGW